MPRLERVMLVFAVLVTAIFIIIPLAYPIWYGAAAAILYAILTLVSPLLLVVSGYALLRVRSTENFILLGALVLNTALGAHDSFAYREMLGFDQPYLLPLGLPMMLFAVAALLVKRFVATLSSYDSLNTELAERVAQRERELKASYQQLRELDQQRATAEERQQLMRDMHDGIGSHLMSTLALARMGSLSQKDLAEVLADCIDELKMTIDSLEPVESDLLVVLGNLRYRLEPRLNAAGITLEWAVSDLPPLPYLDPENVRSVLRIVQEAFTNTLKHAHAKHITLSTRIDAASRRAVVQICDDGNGNGIDGNTNVAAEGKRSGRGIDNMKSRAARLGGEVEVLALSGGGTGVNLYLPLDKCPAVA
jgi:signal transduction histidine kinase